MTQATDVQTEDTLVTLSDGNEYVLQDVLTVEYNGQETDYAVLLPEQDPSADTVAALIMRFSEDGGLPDGHFEEINSEEEFSHAESAIREFYGNNIAEAA